MDEGTGRVNHISKFLATGTVFISWPGMSRLPSKGILLGSRSRNRNTLLLLGVGVNIGTFTEIDQSKFVSAGIAYSVSPAFPAGLSNCRRTSCSGSQRGSRQLGSSSVTRGRPKHPLRIGSLLVQFGLRSPSRSFVTGQRTLYRSGAEMCMYPPHGIGKRIFSAMNIGTIVPATPGYCAETCICLMGYGSDNLPQATGPWRL
mmetsp:Transcript_39821/g.64356  ORF Transcript_39821/g.64356 Transcript_39821/m.64356 type:complete len:202 (-) Transcript_39821:192-797(-)